MENQFEDKQEFIEEIEYTDPNASYNQMNSNEKYEYYQQPIQNQVHELDQSPMSMGSWVLTILVMFIPCAGIILYLIWAFGKNGNVNRRNYCRAYLVIYAVIIAIYLLIVLVFGAAFASGI